MIKIKRSPIKQIKFKDLKVGDIFSVGEFIEAVPFQEIFMRIKPDKKNPYNVINLNNLNFCNFKNTYKVCFITNSSIEFAKTFKDTEGGADLPNSQNIYLGFSCIIKTLKKVKFKDIKIGEMFSFYGNKHYKKKIYYSSLKLSDFSYLSFDDGNIIDFSDKESEEAKMSLEDINKSDIYKLDVTFDFRLR